MAVMIAAQIAPATLDPAIADPGSARQSARGPYFTTFAVFIAPRENITTMEAGLCSRR